MSAALTKDKIERLAPDQASLGAALKLVKPSKWPVLGSDAGTTLLWGECLGSGATPYRVVVATADLGYKCTCPSRKFPCKHALALMWHYCDRPGHFVERAVPGWVDDWLARRRGKSGNEAAAGVGSDAAASGARTPRGGSIAAALVEAPAASPPDPKAAARAEAQRERIRQEREASILSGLDELDLWIADQLNHGIAGFAVNAVKSCRTLAARLVDAKAAGLAGLLDGLAADVFRVPEAQRAELVMERLAAMTLIAAAYRRQDVLPQALKADVRRAVGWTVKREELLAGATALRATGSWMVVAARSEVQPDKLRRLETWLLRLDNEESNPHAPRFALLLDFIPVSAGAQASPYTPGEMLLAELVFYPSATPLRAHIAKSEPIPFDPLAEPPPWPQFPAGLGQALDSYDAALASQPWLDAWPLAVSQVHLVRGESSGLLVTGADGVTLPLSASQAEAVLPLLGLGEVAITGLWDGRQLTLFAAKTPLGLWYEA
jgi:hypothetical protein